MSCIVCGERPPCFEGLCASCLTERRRIVELPRYTELVRCAHCGSVLVGRRWRNSRGERADIEEAVRRALKLTLFEGAEMETEVEVLSVREGAAEAEARASMSAGGGRIEQRARTSLRIRRAVCERCSRIRGKYYEAVLQVRTDGRPLSQEELELVRRKLAEACGPEEVSDRSDYIAKEEEVDGGLDVQLGRAARGRALAKALTSMLGGRIAESFKLVGRREGKNVYRTTFLVRLPGLRAGDFARIKGRVLMVQRIGPGGASCVDLASGEELMVKEKELEAGSRVGGAEIAEEAVVLEERRPELQLLDPSSLRPVSVVAPDWFWAAEGRGRAESVRILRLGGDIFLVPERRG